MPSINRNYSMEGTIIISYIFTHIIHDCIQCLKWLLSKIKNNDVVIGEKVNDVVLGEKVNEIVIGKFSSMPLVNGETFKNQKKLLNTIANLQKELKERDEYLIEYEKQFCYL